MGLDRGISLLVAASLGWLSGCSFDAGSLGGGVSQGEGSSSDDAFASTTEAGSDGSDGPNGTNGSATDSGGPDEEGSTSNAGESTEDTTGGESSDDTTGGVSQVFVDAGLLVRYFIDESDQGTEIKAVLDAATDPLDLPIDYVGGLAYDEVEGHRGLRWDAPGQDGGPVIDVAETKLRALDGADEATLEVVVDVDAVVDSGSRFVHFGFEFASDFALAAESMDTVYLRAFNVTVAQWPVDLNAEGRVVLTAVLDTQQPRPDERFRLYVDGTRVEGTVNEEVDTTDLDLDSGALFALGNRSDGQRSFTGMLYYAAVYEQALTPAEIQNNAALLLSSDDAR